MLIVQPEPVLPMSLLHHLAILLLVIGLTCSAGCSEYSGTGNQTSPPGDPAGAFGTGDRQTLAQPGETARMIRMATDLYNAGDVVEFVITNDKARDLSCTHDPPLFSVRYQKDTGQWITRMGEENPPPGNTTNIRPGSSTDPYRFVTTGWSPGRYRIVTDCGVSREILIRAVPLSAPASASPSCPQKTNASPYIRVDPIRDQQAGEPFAITGTTNLPAGEVIGYSLFAIVAGTSNITSAKLVSATIPVAAGDCGVNTWYVDGVIHVPGDYFIGVSNAANSVSAVKRFTVLEKTGPTRTATLPERTQVPGITTGDPADDPFGSPGG